MVKIKLNELFSCCLDASCRYFALFFLFLGRAAESLRKNREKDNLSVKFKTSRQDPVSAADLESQHIIAALINSSFPDVTIVGEETIKISSTDSSLSLSSISSLTSSFSRSSFLSQSPVKFSFHQKLTPPRLDLFPIAIRDVDMDDISIFSFVLN
jgi:hypothetical protein